MTTKVLGIINNPDKEESNKIVLNSLNEEKAKISMLTILLK